MQICAEGALPLHILTDVQSCVMLENISLTHTYVHCILQFNFDRSMKYTNNNRDILLKLTFFTRTVWRGCHG